MANSPDTYHTVTPYLVVPDADAELTFLKAAFGGAEATCQRNADNTVMHAEIKIGDSLIMMNDEMGGGKSPKAIGGSPASLWLYVEDCDALFNRAVAAGAQTAGGPMGQMADQFWGDRCGTFTDPHGYRWTIATHKEDLSRQELEQRQAEWMKTFANQPAHK